MLARKDWVDRKEGQIRIHLVELGFNTSLFAVKHHGEQPAKASFSDIRCIEAGGVEFVKPLLSPHNFLFISDEAHFSLKVRYLEEGVVDFGFVLNDTFDSDFARVYQLLDFFYIDKDKILLLLRYVQRLDVERIDLRLEKLAHFDHVATPSKHVERRRFENLVAVVVNQRVIIVKVHSVFLSIMA